MVRQNTQAVNRNRFRRAHHAEALRQKGTLDLIEGTAPRQQFYRRAVAAVYDRRRRKKKRSERTSRRSRDMASRTGNRHVV
jgi:hypothetical protein